MLLVALLFACRPAPAPETVPLRFGMGLWPGHFPAIIAERKGLMAERGIALQIDTADDTKALIAEFAAGGYDLAAVSLGDAITLSRSRPDLVVLLVADESTGGDQVLRSQRLEGDPLSANPLRLGTTLGGFGELFLDTWVEQADVDRRRVLWTNVDGSEIPKALAEGRIDIGHTWQPYANQAQALGATTIFSSADSPGLILDVVLTTRAALASKPEAIRGFAAAWFEATEYWRANGAEGDALVAEALGLAPGSISLEGVSLYGLDDNRHVMAGGADAPLAMVIGRYSDFFIERGSLSAPPDAAAMFDPALLGSP